MKTIIRYLRQEVKMSQQDLAKSAGVTRQTINALENGRYNPSLLLAYNITRILNKATYGDDVDSYLSIEDVFKFDDDEISV
ncbi:transcriptional regulator [Methanobrevibacter ruminantium M1]|uniref:Transcriptional regulator n=1 Tax=Methanobrevibacter ruminantium (strain ATCC 35063 / DSM 1093 / JCM 13430 / OCM 146 / M1) TaxID=634498 RepID=D3DZC9_METRM|nr:helix-turn-helix transcriptional regulator [Methanobrevibacter ruminantium]ADC46084.1 transcriptional regulator [Methanobrevibacter ruminantium M1]